MSPSEIRWVAPPTRPLMAAVFAFAVFLVVVGIVAGDPADDQLQQTSPSSAADQAGAKAPARPEPTLSRSPSAGPSASSEAESAPVPVPAQRSAEQVIAAAPPATALAALGTLEVKGRAPRTGYDRDLFGPAWADTDRNGCDTRNDTLARDMTAETLEPGTRNCVVLTGQLAEPYAGRAITFTKADADAIHIDHVVALSNAWQTGAQQWSADKRLAFANDPLNLLAVDGPTNSAKSDGDAATWLPPNRAYRCPMVARQTAVKVKYDLWVVPAERDAIARVLAGCPAEPAPVGGNPTAAPAAAAPRGPDATPADRLTG